MILMLVALAAGCFSDWLRRERVFFARPLPEFTTIPAEK